jgi:hypothetical protein
MIFDRDVLLAVLSVACTTQRDFAYAIRCCRHWYSLRQRLLKNVWVWGVSGDAFLHLSAPQWSPVRKLFLLDLKWQPPAHFTFPQTLQHLEVLFWSAQVIRGPLRALTNLKKLNMSLWDEDDVFFLAHMTTLESLSLGPCHKLTSRSFAFFPKSLRCLSISYASQIDDAACKALTSNLPSLTSFYAFDCGLTSRCFAELCKLPLTSLDIHNLYVHDFSDFSGLFNLPLCRLSLGNSRVASTEHFPASLTELCLSNSSLADGALVDLSRFTNLRLLSVIDSKISPKGCEALRKILPHCRIVCWHVDTCWQKKIAPQ